MKAVSTISPASTIRLAISPTRRMFGIGEAQVAVQAVAQVVAFQQVGVLADGVQLLLHPVGDGRLAGAGMAGY